MLGVDDEVMSVATRGDQFSALAAKFRSLIEIRVQDQGHRGMALAWLGAAEAANEARVQVIHSSWTQSPNDPEQAIVLRLRRSGERVGGLATADQVRAQADAIDEIVVRGIEVNKRLNLL